MKQQAQLLRDFITEIVKTGKVELSKMTIRQEKVRAAIQNYIGGRISLGELLPDIIADVQRRIKDDDVTIAEEILKTKKIPATWRQDALLALPALKMIPSHAFHALAQIPSKNLRHK